MRRRLLIALAVLFAGCGSSHPTIKSKVNTICAQRHELGCAIREKARLEGKHYPKLTLTIGQLCTDVSRYQGGYPNLSGVRCVIIQSNYGEHVEGSVYSQKQDAREHHVPFGCYTFMEPGVSGEGQADLANRLCGRSSGQTLGLWADAELSGTYSHACPYTARAGRWGDLAGLYSAPGLYEGGRCSGYLWPAEWGSSPYPFAGYPRSAVVLQQTCGTCSLNGVETDLDRNLGLIELGNQCNAECQRNKERAKLHADERELLALRARIAVLRSVLVKYGCRARVAKHEHLGPTCLRWFAEGNADGARGKALDAAVRKYHERGIF